MEIDKVKIYQISLPFRREFSHSLRKRTSANNIVVEIIADNGTIRGYGEGAPRTYVTGESQESVTESICDFLQKDSFPWELNYVSQIWDFVDSLPSRKEHNVAICALEMSLLDLLGKRQNKSITEFFPHDFFNNTIYYGAAIPLTNKQRIVEICRLINEMKINKLKLKMGNNFAQNEEAVKAINLVFGNDHDLKIDVNGVWTQALAFKHIPLFEEYNIKIVEQPMMPNDPDIADFAWRMQQYDITLMADESACTLQQVEDIIEDGHYKMINVRLSKCGGFRRSLRIIDYLRSKGLSFQIACQLGESGILSAAGRALGLLCSDAVYYDGSYDDLLLKENITLENVSFGPGGEAGPLDGPGLGVKISNQSLERLSDDSTTIIMSRA